MLQADSCGHFAHSRIAMPVPRDASRLRARDGSARATDPTSFNDADGRLCTPSWERRRGRGMQEPGLKPPSHSQLLSGVTACRICSRIPGKSFDPGTALRGRQPRSYTWLTRYSLDEHICQPPRGPGPTPRLQKRPRQTKPAARPRAHKPQSAKDQTRDVQKRPMTGHP